MSPSIPTQTEAAPEVPLGVGTTKEAATEVKVLPAGGAVRTAPDQFEEYSTWVVLGVRPSSSLSVELEIRILGLDWRTRLARRSKGWAMPAKAPEARRTLLRRAEENFILTAIEVETGSEGKFRMRTKNILKSESWRSEIRQEQSAGMKSYQLSLDREEIQDGAARVLYIHPELCSL